MDTQAKPAKVEPGQVWHLYPVETSEEWVVASVTLSVGRHIVAFIGGGWAFAEEMLDNKVGWRFLR
jgi:hypothetical protein